MEPPFKVMASSKSYSCLKASSHISQGLGTKPQVSPEATLMLPQLRTGLSVSLLGGEVADVM